MANVGTTLADKLVYIAENQQRVYDAGYAAGQAQGGGTLGGLPIYETDVTYTGRSSNITITHNLNTQKFLLIGRVKEHDGTDTNSYRASQVVVWSPYAYFQDADYPLAQGGTCNPYESFVVGDRAVGAYVSVVNNGSDTATAPAWASASLKRSVVLVRISDNDFLVTTNNFMLTNSTWHFTVVDVSSIM